MNNHLIITVVGDVFFQTLNYITYYIKSIVKIFIDFLFEDFHTPKHKSPICAIESYDFSDEINICPHNTNQNDNIYCYFVVHTPKKTQTPLDIIFAQFILDDVRIYQNCEIDNDSKYLRNETRTKINLNK